MEKQIPYLIDDAKLSFEKAKSYEKTIKEKTARYFTENPYKNCMIDIVAANGEVIAKDLFIVSDKRLLCIDRGQQYVPAGMYLPSSFEEQVLDRDFGDSPKYISFNKSDLCCETQEGSWSGCCGPDGHCWSILDTQGNPIAREFGDCWGKHSIMIDDGQYEIVNFRPATPHIFVETLFFKDEWGILSAAAGSSKESAITKLEKASQVRIDTEQENLDEEKQINIATLPRKIVPFNPDDSIWREVSWFGWLDDI